MKQSDPTNKFFFSRLLDMRSVNTLRDISSACRAFPFILNNKTSETPPKRSFVQWSKMCSAAVERGGILWSKKTPHIYRRTPRLSARMEEPLRASPIADVLFATCSKSGEDLKAVKILSILPNFQKFSEQNQTPNDTNDAILDQ